MRLWAVKLLSRRRLREFWEEFPDGAEPLRTWAAVVEAASWRSTADVKAAYSTASVLKGKRVVFNIGGNKYRLVVSVKYASDKRRGVVFVRFIGTHAEYDGIDANEI